MTNEERELITRFIERVGGPAASGGFASVPSTGASNLPPVDREADQLLAELFQKYPEARYRVTQVAVVHEQALAQATQRIGQLQAELQRLQSAAAPPSAGGSPWGQPQQPQPQPPQQSRGLFGGLFGGGQPRQAPATAAPAYAPQPAAYAPPYAPAPGTFQPQGRGFLGGALQTAAGVAGGVLAADALTSLFSGGHGGGGGGLFGGVSNPGETGFLPSMPTETPWGSAAAPAGFTPDPFDQGGALKDPAGSDPYAANTGGDSGWAPVADASPDTGWQDTSTDSGTDSGWQDSGSDSGWSDS